MLLNIKHMNTIASVTKELLEENTYYADVLADGIANVSELARRLAPQIKERLWKEEVSQAAIVMALKRLEKTYSSSATHAVDLSELGDITVRSNLTLFTYENSIELISAQKRLLGFVAEANDRFLNISQGLLETSMVVSTEAIPIVEKELGNQKPVYREDGLACITLAIPHDSTFVPGYIYNIMRPIARANINIIDIVSVDKEITFIFYDDDIEEAFSVLKRLQKRSRK